jgi:hypothetical protein
MPCKRNDARRLDLRLGFTDFNSSIVFIVKEGGPLCHIDSGKDVADRSLF